MILSITKKLNVPHIRVTKGIPMNIKDCKGCLCDRISNNGICELRFIKAEPQIFNKIPMCPCTRCLIKGICNDECQEYHTYINLIKESVWLHDEYKRL